MRVDQFLQVSQVLRSNLLAHFGDGLLLLGFILDVNRLDDGTI
jgi:hypothetical protein